MITTQQRALLTRITNWYDFKMGLMASVEEQMAKYNPSGADAQWFVAVPVAPGTNRRRIAMQLTTEAIREAMERDDNFTQPYFGQPLFRQETYSAWYRFTPGDWVMCDVRGANPTSPEDEADLSRHAPLQLTPDKKYCLKRIRKVLGGEVQNGAGLTVRNFMVRTIDENSFNGTYGWVEKKRDEIMCEMHYEQVHRGLKMAPSEVLEKRMKMACIPHFSGSPFLLGLRYAIYKNLSKAEGEGADGTVWFARDVKDNNREVVIKMFQSSVDDDEKLRARATREWAMVKRIRDLGLAPKDACPEHPIVALIETSYGTVSQGASDEGCVYYQVMERCDCDLFTPLSKKKPGWGYQFTEPLARWLFGQVIQGVKMMNDQGLYHRDLKMENILLKVSRHSLSALFCWFLDSYCVSPLSFDMLHLG